MPSNPARSVLTVGMFDGVHLGHQLVISNTCEDAKAQGTGSHIVTFENHPSSLFNPESAKPLITTRAHKIKLIRAFKPDRLSVLPFNKALASLTAEEFLRLFNPAALILGYDAKIGRDRSGDPAHLKELSQKLNFLLHYIPPLLIDEAPISSSRIRIALSQGDLTEVSRLLGRPYSIFAPVKPGTGRGKALGFPTINLDVSNLALPPLGVWAVSVNGKRAIANLGVAPTFHRAGPPILEVHFIDPPIDDDSLDVTFHRFIRHERAFPSVEELKKQIQLDIESLH